MKQNENIITAVDIGEVKTVVLVTEITGSRLRYRGHGIAESLGSCEGVIVDLEKSAASLQEAINEAELRANVPLQRAVVGVAGTHIRASNSRGRIVLGLRPREVSLEDICQAAKTAQTAPLPEDRQVLHLFPQNFILDEQDCSRFPVGMVGRQLTVHAHIVTASASAVQNIVTVMNRAGIYVEDTVYEPLASSDAVLQSDERQLGVCVCDIGASSMDVVVFHEGVVVHSSSIPTGRSQDRNSSCALTSIRGGRDRATIRMPFEPGNLENKVPLMGDRTLRLVSQRPLSEAREARAKEMVEMLRDNLRQARVLEMLGAGVVFVGGGARLPGVIENADAILRCPTRMGTPIPVLKLPALLSEPEFATVIGMALYAHRARVFKTH